MSARKSQPLFVSSFLPPFSIGAEKGKFEDLRAQVQLFSLNPDMFQKQV